MLNTSEVMRAVKDAQDRAAADPRYQTERAAILRELGAQVTELTREWQRYLEYRYASDLPSSLYPKLSAKAAEYSYAKGYHETELQYSKLAEFARLARQA
jgi:hypothetical protein